MTKRTTYLASLAVLALGAVSAPSAQAKFVAVFEEVGSNVEEIGDGTIDLTDLGSAGGTFQIRPSVSPDVGTAVMGTPFTTGTFFDGVLTAPSNFGPGDGARANGGSGDGVVISTPSLSIAVPLGYTSGAPLFNTSFYLNATFASLGMTPGVYIWTWGSGFDADSLTIDIATPVFASNPDIPVFSNSVLRADLPLATQVVFPLQVSVPEPSTWAMMLVGFAGLGYAAVRRKGARRSVSA